MSNFHEIVGIVAGVLFIPVTIFYIKGMIKGETKPNRATWFIWSVVSIIILVSYTSSGAKETIWVPTAYAIGSIIIFLFTLKYGVGGFDKFDRWCLGGAGFSLVLWMILGPVAALTAGIAVDLAGLLPTIKKMHYEPWTEDKMAWSISSIGSILNMFAVKEWSFAIGVYPVYILLAHVIMIILLFRPRKKQGFKPATQ